VSSRRRKAGSVTALAGVVATAAGLSTLALAPGSGLASSHREAPLIANDPQADNTDLYAFVSPDDADSVTLIANWLPFQEPGGGPNFYPFAENTRHEIHIDNNADAKADITYRWTFTTAYKSKDTFLYATGPVTSLDDPTLNVTQTYKLEEIKGDATRVLVDGGKVAPSHVGVGSMPNYAALRDQAVVDTQEVTGKSFAGQADDPFFLDLRVFDLLYGGNLKEVGSDTLDGFNVNTLALQVKKSDLAAAGDSAASPIVGVWSTTSRPATRLTAADGTQTFSGDFVQVSRLGSPLVNEVVVPLQFKDAFNASLPEGDAQFLPKVEDPEVPKLIEAVYKIPAPKTPRADLVSVFLTGVEGLNKPANGTPSEMLRLNMSIPAAGEGNRLGVIGGDKAGFPNGRRLSDDVVDIALQVIEGELVGAANDLGDAVNNNDVRFGDAFPYVALPHAGSKVRPGSLGNSQVQGLAVSGGAPVGAVGTGAGGTAPGTSSPAVPLAIALAGATLVAAGLVVRKRALI